MRMVKAISGATEGEFKRLTDAAEKLGRETSYTDKEVAEGMTAMGRMGLKPDEILSAVPAVLSLARATGTELGEAAEIASSFAAYIVDSPLCSTKRFSDTACSSRC